MKELTQAEWLLYPFKFYKLDGKGGFTLRDKASDFVWLADTGDREVSQHVAHVRESLRRGETCGLSTHEILFLATMQQAPDVRKKVRKALREREVMCESTWSDPIAGSSQNTEAQDSVTVQKLVHEHYRLISRSLYCNHTRPVRQ